MASRMEKYYRSNNNTNKRSQRNQELYKDIYDYSEYSNIEAVATMDKTNEVDITKIQNMLKNRENYKKQRKYNEIIKKEPEEKETISHDFTKEEDEKIYDIRDILNKAKDKKPEEETHRSLDNTNYNILKNLKLNNDKKDDDLKSIIEDIDNTSSLNQMTDKELGLKMFDLEETRRTSVGEQNSITKILEQAKKYEKKKEEEREEIDNSFYTSSLNFSKEDFEEANGYITKKRKSKIILKILLFIGLIILTSLIIFGVYYLIK